MPLVLKMAAPQQRSWCVLQLAKKESITAVQPASRKQFHMEPPSRVSIYARYKEFEQKGCICIHHYGDTAQSLGRVGLSSRHLPCDSRSTYRVSVRCVRNFESFSIDWWKCEVLSPPHLLSISCWKCKVLLSSLCIYTMNSTKNNVETNNNAIIEQATAGVRMYRHFAENF
jgi:hypothetical protein